MVTIRDVLAHKGTSVVTVTPDSTVRQAVDTMNEHRIGAVLVTAPQLAGIFTERDVLTRVVATGRSADRTRVRDVMSSNLTCVSPQHGVCEVLRRMTCERHRHMPVVDAARVVGLVSLGDLIAQLIRDLDTEVKDLAEYIAGPAVRRTHEEILILSGRDSSCPQR